jgi:hypothetical protein
MNDYSNVNIGGNSHQRDTQLTSHANILQQQNENDVTCC